MEITIAEETRNEYMLRIAIIKLNEHQLNSELGYIGKVNDKEMSKCNPELKCFLILFTTMSTNTLSIYIRTFYNI